MYKCQTCGRIFAELIEWEEFRGECFGFPSYEKMSGCCCGSMDVIELNEDFDEPEARGFDEYGL